MTWRPACILVDVRKTHGVIAHDAFGRELRADFELRLDQSDDVERGGEAASGIRRELAKTAA